MARKHKPEEIIGKLLDDDVGWLPGLAKFPVPRRTLVGRVENRIFEELLAHCLFLSQATITLQC